jgi:4-hydroxy-3-methylbut-2-enyl diphosphate reductase
VFDATCPLVTKVHVEVSKMLREGYEIVMIGHRGHPESEGTMGQSDSGMHLVETSRTWRGSRGEPASCSYVTQTTLSVDDAAQIVAALRARFPAMRGPKRDDICYATQNRQDAVKFMAPRCDVVIVVGSPNSSNSNRLREVAQNMGVGAYMVDSAADLKPEWIAGKPRVGVTAGRFGAGSAGERADRAAAGSWAPRACARWRASPSTSSSRCRASSRPGNNRYLHHSWICACVRVFSCASWLSSR